MRQTTWMACSGFVLLLGLIAAPAAWTEEKETPLSDYFGFQDLEIFKLERRSGNMLVGDVNGDALNDIVLIDNSHSRIDVLQQRAADDPALTEPPATRLRVNEIPSDRRFSHEKIPVDRELSAIVLADLNSDSKTDIVYFGTPDRLVVRYQSEEDSWSKKHDVRLPDVKPVSWTIGAGDMNSDGRTDVVVLGQNVTYVIFQEEDGTLSTPAILRNASDNTRLLQVADLDGDGRSDVCYLDDKNSDRSIVARLQDNAGKLGPELFLEMKMPRSITLTDVDGKAGAEVVTIDGQTDRVQISQLRRPETDKEIAASQPVQFGFGEQGSGRDRDLVIADVDGDDLADVVVTDPEGAQIILYRQRANEGLDLGTPFPSLVGGEQLRAGDFDGDGDDEIIVLSTREKTVGLVEFENGRLTFPQPLPASKETVAIEVTDFTGDGKLDIVTVVDDSQKGLLEALTRDDEGNWKPVTVAGEDDEKATSTLAMLTDPKTRPRLKAVDLDGDENVEFLWFSGVGRDVNVVQADEDGKYTELAAQSGPGLGKADYGALFVGELGEGPTLLVAQNNFARQMDFEDRRWRVADQFNAMGPKAKVEGVATLDLDGEAGNEVVLIDTGSGRLQILKKEEQLYKPWTEVELGRFPYRSLETADLNGDGRNDLLLFGQGAFAVIYTGQTDPVLADVANFESTLKDTYFSDVIAGDVNGDGQ